MNDPECSGLNELGKGVPGFRHGAGGAVDPYTVPPLLDQDPGIVLLPVLDSDFHEEGLLGQANAAKDLSQHAVLAVLAIYLRIMSGEQEWMRVAVIGDHRDR